MESSLYDEMYRLEGAHWWFAARRAILLSLVERYLPAKTGNQILDIGCGTGLLMTALERYGAVTGADASAQAVAYSASHGCATVRYCLLPHEVPFTPHSFTLVTLCDVLEHVPDDEAALLCVRHLLKPGGLLLCTAPAFRWLWSSHDVIHHHQRRYARGELRRKIRAAGLRVRKHSYFNTVLFPLITARRLLGSRRPQLPASDLQMPAPTLNTLLYRLFASERHWLRYGRFPIGVSEVVVAERE